MPPTSPTSSPLEKKTAHGDESARQLDPLGIGGEPNHLCRNGLVVIRRAEVEFGLYLAALCIVLLRIGKNAH